MLKRLTTVIDFLPDQAIISILTQIVITDQTIKRTRPFLIQEPSNIQLTLGLFSRGFFFFQLLEIKDANPPD